MLLARQVFATGLGGAGGGISVESVRMDPSNNSYITGSFAGTVTLGNTVLTSNGSNDIFVAKLGANGNVLWARGMGSPNVADGDFGRAVALSPGGDVVVTGFFSGPTNFGGGTVTPVGTRDVFIAKYDTSGNFIWARTYGGPGFDLGQSVAIDTAGNIYSTGSFEGTVNFGGTNLASVGNSDVYLLKLNAAGNTQWAKRMGGLERDQGFSIAVDAAGNTYSTGVFRSIAGFGGTNLTSVGETDAFVLKTDTSGNTLWARSMGGFGFDNGTAVAVDFNGNVFVTGDYVGAARFVTINIPNTANNGTSDAFITKLTPAGNVEWAYGYGGPQTDAGFNIAVDPFGFVYATGVFQGAANFGGQPLNSVGGFDVFWLKLHINGNVDQAVSFGSVGDDQAYQVTTEGGNGRFTLVGNLAAPATIGGVALTAPSGAYVVQYANTKPQVDFDGTGTTQPAVFRRSTSQWYVKRAGGNNLFTTYGQPNLIDIPVAGDYDGDGRADPAYYKDATAQWFVQLSSNNYASQLFKTFGWGGVDVPVPGDYDGDGKTDPAVYRPTTAQWFVQYSSLNYQGSLLTPNGFGWPGVDIPAPGDYDGDGKTDPAVYRPTTAQWFGQSSAKNYAGSQLITGGFGWPGVDVPAPGDYDGTGKTQIAVYRPTTGQYFIRQTGGGTRVVAFGGPNYMDLPLQTSIGALKRFGWIPGVSSFSATASLTTASSVSAPLVVLSAPTVAPAESAFESTAWSSPFTRRPNPFGPRKA